MMISIGSVTFPSHVDKHRKAISMVEVENEARFLFAEAKSSVGYKVLEALLRRAEKSPCGTKASRGI